MGIAESLLKIAELSLQIYIGEKKEKYFEQYLYLKRTIRNELAKDINTQDYNVIDRAQFELLLLTRKTLETIATPTRSDLSD